MRLQSYNIGTALILGSLLASPVLFAQERGESRESGPGNGGSIVVDGTEYRLADLHFETTRHQTFKFDQDLSQSLLKAEDALDRVRLVALQKNDENFRGREIPPFPTGGRNLFREQVFSNLVEYRFVSKLPDTCRFMSPENLPSEIPIKDIACTHGSITYLIPSAFSKLSLHEKALLIVHERLHAYAPDQPYDVKCEYIQGLDVLMRRWYPAYLEYDKTLQLTPNEVFKLNRLSKRSRQLSNGFGAEVSFFENGGRYYGSEDHLEVSADELQVDVRSRLTGAKDQRSPKEKMKIHGNRIYIENSDIHSRDLYITDTTIRNSTIRNAGSNSMTRLIGMNINGSKIISSSLSGTLSTLKNVNIDVYNNKITVSPLTTVSDILNFESLGALQFGSNTGTPTSIDGLNHKFQSPSRQSDVDIIDSQAALNQFWIEYYWLRSEKYLNTIMIENSEVRFYSWDGNPDGYQLSRQSSRPPYFIETYRKGDRLDSVRFSYSGVGSYFKRTLQDHFEGNRRDDGVIQIPLKKEISWSDIENSTEVQVEIRIRNLNGRRELAVVFLYPKKRNSELYNRRAVNEYVKKSHKFGDEAYTYSFPSLPCNHVFLVDWTPIIED